MSVTSVFKNPTTHSALLFVGGVSENVSAGGSVSKTLTSMVDYKFGTDTVDAELTADVTNGDAAPVTVFVKGQPDIVVAPGETKTVASIHRPPDQRLVIHIA